MGELAGCATECAAGPVAASRPSAATEERRSGIGNRRGQRRQNNHREEGGHRDHRECKKKQAFYLRSLFAARNPACPAGGRRAQSSQKSQHCLASLGRNQRGIYLALRRRGAEIEKAIQFFAFLCALRLCARLIPPTICAACKDFAGLWHGYSTIQHGPTQN